MVATEYVLNVQEEGAVIEWQRSPATPSGRANLEKIKDSLRGAEFAWISTVFETALLESSDLDESLAQLEKITNGSTLKPSSEPHQSSPAAPNCNCGEDHIGRSGFAGNVCSTGAIAPSGASAVYPAIGANQCCAGQENGIWYTWLLLDGVRKQRHSHSSRSDAFEAHDNNIVVIKVANGVTNL